MRAMAPALIAVLALGCGSKVNFESSAPLQGDGIHTFLIDAPKKEQRVRVEVNASPDPVDVAIVLEKDASDFEMELARSRDKRPASALDIKRIVQSATLEATIPAGEPYVVFLQGRGKSTVAKVKINSL